MKFITIVKSAELTGPPPPEALPLFDAINQLGADATKAGVFVEMGGLAPTAMGARVRIAKGKITVTDGPFTEAKEVIGGYAIYDVPPKAEAIAWTRRFLELHKKHWPAWEGEVEVRQLFA